MDFSCKNPYILSKKKSTVRIVTYEPIEFEKCELSTFSFDICLHSATGQPQLTIILQSAACNVKKGGEKEEEEEEVEEVEGEREKKRKERRKRKDKKRKGKKKNVNKMI